MASTSTVKRPQAAEIENDPVVDVAIASDVVAAAANGERQLVLADESENRSDVIDRSRLDDSQRTAIDHAVPDAARVVVRGVCLDDHLPPDVAAENREATVAFGQVRCPLAMS